MSGGGNDAAATLKSLVSPAVIKLPSPPKVAMLSKVVVARPLFFANDREKSAGFALSRFPDFFSDV
jgi:hypothetical protein